MQFQLNPKISETALIESVIRKERWAQKALYDEYYGYLMSVCLRYSDSENEAEDLLHESFIKIFNNIDKYIVGTSLKNWVMKIAVNTAIDNMRKKKNAKIIKLEVAGEFQFVTEDALSQLTAEEIIKAIQKLSDIYRSIFNLYVIEGYSHKEISELLNISESTSRSNLVKARKKLKEILLNNENFYDSKNI